MAQKELDIKLRKMFQGIEFWDFFKLTTKVAEYEELVRKEYQRKKASTRTHYQEVNYNIGIEVVVSGSCVYPELTRVYGRSYKKKEPRKK